MKFSDLYFFLSETYLSIRRSNIMSLVAIFTMSLCMIVFGIFLLINLNFRYISDVIASKLDIHVFLNEPLSKNEHYQFQQKIKK